MFKKFAVAGAGRLGTRLVEALSSRPGVLVVVLSRGSRSIEETGLPKAGNVILEQGVDYDDPAKVSSIFQKHGIEVVISTFGVTAITDQMHLVDACCHTFGAGTNTVKLYVPSEFGTATDEAGENAGGLNGAKMKIANYVKQKGIASTTFYNGFWSGNIPWFTGVTENGKVNIVGKGETPVSFTAIEDVVGFAAHALTTLPPSKLNRTFRVEGDRATLHEVGDVMATEIVYVDSVPGAMSGLKTALQKSMDAGLGDIRPKDGNEELCNSLWEGHQWIGIKEALQKGKVVT